MSAVPILTALEHNTLMDKKPSKPVNADRKIAARFGADLTAAGWTAIPNVNVIVKRQKALGLDALDVNIILQLLLYWWEDGNLPHPSKRTVADAIGVDPRTVQRRIAAMESAGFIQRIQRGSKANGNSSNLYDFKGLIEAAQPFAREELQDIEKRKQANTEKLARKRPRLAVVNS